jgi:hypothetical protein
LEAKIYPESYPFGDENTKKIHVMATERYRKNVISQIQDDYGRMVTDHDEKVLFFPRFQEKTWHNSGY